MRRLILALSFLAAVNTSYAQKTWTPVSQDISFKIKNAGLYVNGTFDGGRSTLLFSPDKLQASSLKETVEVGTLKTGIGLRDKHLKGELYFNEDSFKTIEVASTKIYAKNADYAGMFNVKIKGVTKEIEIPFEFNEFGDEADIKGTFTINRKDFNVGGSSVTMSDEVEVSIHIKVRRS